MPRRVSLPGADELFRTTGGMALQASARQHNGEGQTAERLRPVPAQAGESDSAAAATEEPTAAPDDAHRAHPAERAGRSEQHTHAGREPAPADSEHRRQDPSGVRGGPGGPAAALSGPARPAGQKPGQPRPQPGQEPPRRKQRAANRRPSGRERHDEKITVYVSAEELMDLEHARLVLRGEHGLAVDRGRIVREAVAVVLADLESRGDASILVRRLRGR